MQNFAGKEYDTVTLVPSYLVASLIVGAMDTDDRYLVDADTEIALLQNARTNEVVQMFHALDVNKVIESMEAQGFEIDKGNSPETATRGMTSFIGHNTISFFVGDYTLTFPVVIFLEKATGRLRRIADIENIGFKLYLDCGDKNWEEMAVSPHIGFKKSDPTGYFIEELTALLKRYERY